MCAMNESGVFGRNCLGFDWSTWLAMDSTGDELSELATDPGVYRVRHDAYEGLVYIGQTGVGIRGRIRALARGIFDGAMPYSDPHTGSPALWAIVDRHGPGFEISAASPDGAGDRQQRHAIEDTLIALHRRETQLNPVGNFGRMPPGYSKSKRASKETRGGRHSDDTYRSYRNGADPLPWEHPDEITSGEWMGLEWSHPYRLDEAPDESPIASGLYRIWDPDDYPPLEYIGQSNNLRSRLNRHRRNRSSRLLVAHVNRPDLDADHKRSQAETDLLGAHWLACRKAPKSQY